MTVDLSGSYVWGRTVGCVCLGQINSQILSVIQRGKNEKTEEKPIPVKDEVLYLKAINCK